jgi:aspartyl protease family protein
MHINQLKIRTSYIFIFLLAQLLFSNSSYAIDVNVVGLATNKAILVINGDKPRTVSIGQTTKSGVKLIRTNTNSVVIEIAGEQRSLVLGQNLSFALPAKGSQVILHADSGGHFYVTARVNNKSSIRLIVDTGATMVTLSYEDARQLNIAANYKKEPIIIATANGLSTAYKIKLNHIQVGNIALSNIDAIVVAKSNKLKIGLLSMSFLNRMTIRKDGSTMTLIKRF